MAEMAPRGQDVFFLPLSGSAESAGAIPNHILDLQSGLEALGKALSLDGSAASTWAMKVHLGPRNRPSAVDPGWANAVAEILHASPAGKSAPRVFAFDTLSITTQGLDKTASHLELARNKGYATADGDLLYLVADGDGQGDGLAVTSPDDSTVEEHFLAGGLADATGLCVLTPVRPHPHVGFRGAVTTMGVGFADRASKIALHRDIRPQVNTPLCAGCGMCLTVCLFDAIQFSAGRAFIDHKQCTGCGECMNVCFMAGINPEEAAGIPYFQAKVADAALMARNRLTEGNGSRQVYFNFLVRLDRQAGGVRTRNRVRLGDVGILVSRDPVALDQATFDMISERMGGQLSDWSGFAQLPDALLARAEAIGLGGRAYNLLTV